MIVWICSYPRSGNTLTRTILKKCFNVKTYSRYSDKEFEFLFGPNLDEWNETVYQRLSDSPEFYFVKNHYVVLDGQPVIHVVRNGLDACASYAKMNEYNIVDVILGEVNDFPDWSTHCKAMMSYANKLTLRFEDMIKDPDKTCEAITGWCGLRKVRDYEDTFKQDRVGNEQVMGEAGAEKKDKIKPNEMQLFNVIHGDMMRRLGYG